MAIHVVYYESRNGDLQLPPDTRDGLDQKFCPAGWEVKEANTIHEIEVLQKRLQDQEKRRIEQEGEREEAVWADRLNQQRSNLYNKIRSSATTEYEKEFFRYWIQLTDEKRRERFKQKYLCDMAAYHFEALEMDVPKKMEDILA